MSLGNSGWVRRRTAALLTAALAITPVLPVTAYAAGVDSVPASDVSSQPSTGSETLENEKPVEDVPSTEDGSGTEDGPTAAKGVASIDDTPYDSLELALAAAVSGQTVTLNQSVEVTSQLNVPEGVTLDGAGNAITAAADIANGGVLDITNNDVTIKNLIINTSGNAKHGIQFYCVTGGSVEGCTINGGRYTSVNVNGSEVSIKDSELNPAEGAYAHVEYGMGLGVTTVPSVALSGVTAGGESDAPLVYVDAATMERVAENSDPKIEATDTAAIVEAINKNLTGTQVYLGENGGATSENPDANPDPDPNPPAETKESVNVAPTTGGAVELSAESAAKGDRVTITLVPEEGQTVGSVTVTDAEGNEVELTKGENDNEYTFEMPDSAVTVTATFVCDGGETCPTHGFDDVDQTAWYHLAVDWAVQTGAMHGYGSGKFGPNDPLTRAQMAAVLYNIADSPEADLSELRPDCVAGAWYSSPVAWALEQGIFNGYDDGTNNFGPEDGLTREQAACVLMNAAKVAGEDVTQRADLSAYPDDDDVSSYAREAMEWAVARGLISGVETETGERVLAPQSVCTRAELAALLMNASE